jgi:hypothetical protein
METIAQDSPRKRITPVDAVHIVEVLKAIIQSAIERSLEAANDLGADPANRGDRQDNSADDERVGHQAALKR